MLSKKISRWESKRKKIEAFLNIAKLNDLDRRKGEPECATSRLHFDSMEKTAVAVLTAAPASASGQSTDPDKPLLPPEELAKLRRELHARQKANAKKPKVYLTLPEYVAADITASNQPGYVVQQKQSPLFVLDLQHLLLQAAQNHFATWKPRWCKLLRPSQLERTVCIIVDELSVEEFRKYHEAMPFLSSRFEMKVEMISPSQYGKPTTQELFDVPVIFRKKAKGRSKLADPSQKKSETDKVHVPPTLGGGRSEHFSRSDLLLNSQQMMEEDYPLPISLDRYKDFVYSKDSYDKVTLTSPLYALDCEMCLTSIHSQELTRVSLVNEKLEVLYDQLAKPPNRITDYLTRYSGITKDLLKGVTTTLRDVQEAIKELLPADAILCGQSLNSDLNALKMFHPYVIDTSIIYNLTGQRHIKSGLKRLTYEFLGREIQTGNKGHNPVEDSSATMELVLLKLQNHPSFGDVICGGEIYPEESNAAPVEGDTPTSDNNNGDKVTGESAHENNAKKDSAHKSGDEKDSSVLNTADTDSVHESKMEKSVKTDKDSSPQTVVSSDNNSAVQNNGKSTSSESRKRKHENSSENSSEDSDEGQQNKKLKLSAEIAIDERKKSFFTQSGSEQYECFFDQCQLKTVALIGREEQLQQFKDKSVETLSATSDKDAVKQARQTIPQHFLTFIHLHKFAQKQIELMSEVEIKHDLSKLDSRIRKIMKSLGDKCLVTVLFAGRTTPVSTHHAMTCATMTT